MTRRNAIPWDEIRREYTEGKISQRALSEKYGVHINSIQKHARDEKWVAGKELTELPALAPVATLGQRTNENARLILDKIKNGWSPLRAFGSCGFSKKEMEEWLLEDTAFLVLTAAARQAILGLAEETLFKAASDRKIYDAALKVLMNSPETRDQYTNDKMGGQKIEINVQIGNEAWDRDKAPVVINGETNVRS